MLLAVVPTPLLLQLPALLLLLLLLSVLTLVAGVW